MKKGKNVGKKLALGVSLVASVFLVLFIAAYFTIQSSHFISQIELALTDLTGDQVEIQGQLEVEQMMPALKLFLPAIKVQSSNQASPYERVRVDELTLTMPTRTLIERFQGGQIALRFNKISMVSRTANSSPVPDAGADTEIKSTQKSLSETINELRLRFPELEVSTYVGHVDYITRDGENQHHQLDDLEVNVDASQVVLSGKYLNDCLLYTSDAADE